VISSLVNKCQQARTGAGAKEAYFPSYESQSGEIVGVLKQMMEEMTADLKEAQQTEALYIYIYTYIHTYTYIHKG